MQSRSQTIAAKVYQQMLARIDDKDDKYRALAKELPTMIQQNGLVHATGFLLSKYQKEDHIKKLLDDFRASFQSLNELNAEAFHNKLVSSELYDSIRYTREALEIAGWMRRYTQGLLDPKKDEPKTANKDKDANV